MIICKEILLRIEKSVYKNIYFLGINIKIRGRVISGFF
jgi:hypothetical protein